MKKHLMITLLLLLTGHNNVNSMQHTTYFAEQIVTNYLNNEISVDNFMQLIEDGALDTDNNYSAQLKEMRLSSYKDKTNYYETIKKLFEIIKNDDQGFNISNRLRFFQGIIWRRYNMHKTALAEGNAVTRPSVPIMQPSDLVLVNESSMNLEYKTKEIDPTPLLANVPVIFNKPTKTLAIRQIKDNGSAGVWHPMFKHVHRINQSKKTDEPKNIIIIKDSKRYSIKWNIELQ